MGSLTDSRPHRTCGGETATFHCLRERKGDQLWVRYNLRAPGSVALIGSGMTVLDSDR